MADKKEKSMQDIAVDSTIKIDDEALKELKSIRGSQQGLQLEIGALEAHKLALVSELHKLGETLKTKMTALEEKYGKGNLSLETGIITPLPEKPEENVNS
tara:strand:+ start:5250 stop:5549 length:300 start_codon:yes stop_codon:yes gene_type:complete